MADANQAGLFGKAAPRALETFGVAGVLGEKSKVFYSSIFTTKHIGRVSDLIAAKLSGEGLDELRLRALLLFGAFEVFRSQGGTAENTSTQRLAEPLVVECGLDDDKIALGVSFTTDEARFPLLDGLADRIAGGKPAGVFEELLSQILGQSHWTIVRAQPAIRRVEIVMLLGVPGKIDAEVLNAKPVLRIVEIPKEQKAEPPKVKAYIELGDLDYPELLKEDVSVKDNAAPATGEVLMHGLKEADEAVKVRAEDLLKAMTSTRVGGAESGDSSVMVKGNGQSQDMIFKVTAGGAMQADDGAMLIKGSGPGAQPGNYALKSYGVPPPPGDEGSSGQVAASQAQAEEEEEGDEEGSDAANRLKEVIDKVKSAWPFRFGKDKAGEEEEEAEAAPASQAAPVPEAKAAAPAEDPKKAVKPDVAASTAQNDEDDDNTAPIPAAAPIKISTADIEREALKLTREIETGLDKTVTRAQNEAGDLKKEMGSTRAKRWVDGLMSELVAEKARLAEASKALNTSIRQKEIEFRTKEQILTEELKRRDDMIRQKTNALNRAKDQLSQAAISAERLKSAKAGAADDAHYKQKYGLVQKMLTSAKDENTELAEKVEDLKNQLMSAQLNPKRGGPSTTDFTALQSKYERSIRQADEFKKTNQQLLDKLAEAKKEKIIAPQDDSKKRLEAAMKMATGYQRDSEKLQTRIEEMQREQMRLHAELSKSSLELKTARLATTKAQAAAIASSEASAKSAAAAKSAQANAAKPATAKPIAPSVAPKAPGVTDAAKPAAAMAPKPALAAAPKQAVAAAVSRPAPPPTAKPIAPSVPAKAPAQLTSVKAAQPAAAKPAAAAKVGTGGKSNPPKAA